MAEGTTLSAAESPGLRSPFPHPDRSQLETELGTGHSIFCYGPKIRKMICTTNAIESLHMQTMEGAQKPGDFPNDESAVKLIYLACDLMPPTPRPIVAAFNRSLCQELLTDPFH
jgi:hypothetical protein